MPATRRDVSSPSASQITSVVFVPEVSDASPVANFDGFKTSNMSNRDDADNAHPTLLYHIPAESPQWRATIETVIKGVVSIHFSRAFSFDTGMAMSSQATGFVVDVQKEYILTNRHVAVGPFWGYCVFDNREECDVYPLYCDPVHDFAYLKFDRAKIKHMQITELELRPDLTHVGTEIRVVGNDAGEELSILAGTISRLDRNAPQYAGEYQDFNTNYIQAAVSAKSGSSGSPVIASKGYAVALLASGRTDNAATNFFLPLDRPLRALECLRRGQLIPRGTIQVQWTIKPFDQCRRLGLSTEKEAVIRKMIPKETGMLVAKTVLPEGPGDKLKDGDILLKVNNKLVTQFDDLGTILDLNVGKSIHLLVQRGRQDFEIFCTVQDLYKITPTRLATVSGAIFHNLSYHQAQRYAIPVRGIYCKATGPLGSLSGSIIDSVDNRPIGNLDDFVKVMEAIPDYARIIVSHRRIHDLQTIQTDIVQIDRHWYPHIRLAEQNNKTGLWDFTYLTSPLPAEPFIPRQAKFTQPDDPVAGKIIRSFVHVSYSTPVWLDGYLALNRDGFGLVIDAEKGLVAVSRGTVLSDLCDISVTVAGSITVSGKVVFSHPLQYYAVIQYDSSLVQAPVQSAQLSTKPVTLGAEVFLVGLCRINPNSPVSTKTVVTGIGSLPGGNTSVPRSRPSDIDIINVDTRLLSGGGVLVSSDGIVQALWVTFLDGDGKEYVFGLDTSCIVPTITQIQRGHLPKLRILGIEKDTISMSQARDMGVPNEWIEKVSIASSSHHQLFKVRKTDSLHSPDFQSLKEGDIILTLNDRLITRVSEFDIVCGQETLNALVIRNQKEIKIKIRTTAALETDHALIFCGAVLQRPYRAVRQKILKLPSEVYISINYLGSPADHYGLAPKSFITAVNEVETHDLNSFSEQASKIPDNTYFCLRIVTLNNVPSVVTMKKNNRYFPMIECIKDSSAPQGWKITTYGAETRCGLP